MSSKPHTNADDGPQASGEEDSGAEPADPFEDEAVTSVIDAAWDDLTS